MARPGPARRAVGVGGAARALARWDVIIGGIFAVAVVFFITIACSASLHAAGRRIATVGEAAEALRPRAGDYAAALFAASILPLSTAYVVCEGLGWERGLGRGFAGAPHFYIIFTALVVLGAGLVLLPEAPLLRILIASQVMNGLLLPAVLILMLVLVSRRSIMGDLVNSRRYSLFCWILCAIIVALDLVLLATAFVPGAAR